MIDSTQIKNTIDVYNEGDTEMDSRLVTGDALMAYIQSKIDT